MQLHEAIDDFYAEKEYQGSRPATILFYRTNIDHFIKDTGAASLEDFSERTLRDWLIAHRSLSAASLQTYDRALRVFTSWLYKRGYLAANPMKDLPKPKAKRLEVRTLTAAEIKAMLAYAKRLRSPLRDAALMMLLLDTGVRIGEACGIELQHIDWQDSYLLVDGKSGQRSVPFGSKTKHALKRYIDLERKAAHSRVRTLFLDHAGLPFKTTAATHRLAKIAHAVNVNASKTGCHIFRHTFGVEYIRAGGDAFSLQRLLGHTSLETTRLYVSLAQTDLREAHRRFSPGSRML